MAYGSFNAGPGKAPDEDVVRTNQIGVPGGIATLDADGHLTESQRPAVDAYTKAETDQRISAAVDAHNGAENAHSDIRASVAAMNASIKAIELKFGTNVTKNPFSATFGSLDGLTVDRRVERRTGEGGVLMAETFKVGANARELLRYTQRATRIVTDDISRSDARKIIQKVAALEDVRDIQKVCGTAVHALDTRDREGFSKSTFRLYGEGIRLTARQILLDAHAANNVNFQTDYDKRVEKIGAVVDGCSLLLEYLTICTEEGIISAKKAGIWTKKVTDVKYPAMKWLTSERGRAEKLRAEAERKRLTEQAAALKAVLYPEP